MQIPFIISIIILFFSAVLYVLSQSPTDWEPQIITKFRDAKPLTLRLT